MFCIEYSIEKSDQVLKGLKTPGTEAHTTTGVVYQV